MADKLTRIDNVCARTRSRKDGESWLPRVTGSDASYIYRFIHYTGLSVGGAAALKQQHRVQVSGQGWRA